MSDKNANKNIRKYLVNYAEPEIKALHSFFERFFEPDGLKQDTYQHVIVIPAYKESDNFITRFLASTLAHKNTLLIVVINQPDTDSEKLPQQLLHKNICQRGELIWQEQSLNLVHLNNSNCDVLLVDRFTKPIPQEQGVGLARKLGVDLAVALHDKGIIDSPWLHSTDADATLPDNYFDALKRANNDAVAVCYNFHHHSDNLEVHQANQQYERALRYYVAGLQYAGSDYAFFTIGSILAFKVTQYCMVRGFPKRSAGEDFYLLNKISKLGAVDFFKDSVIKIDARTSDRVPFGTGPAVNRIISLTANNHEYCYYHPQLFEFLKVFLAAKTKLWISRDNLAVWLKNLPAEVNLALTELNFVSFVNKQCKANQQQFDKQFIVWFDAFKTLKFIHAIRMQGFEDIVLNEAIAQASFSVS